MKIYVARHGKTSWNEQNRICGRTDIELSETGIKQAQDLKRKYSDKNVLLICHGGVSRVINTYFKDMTNEEFFAWNLENGRVEEYGI